MAASKYTAVEKTAIVLLALGQDLAAELLKNLAPKELMPVLRTMQRLGRVSAEDSEALLAEFATTLASNKQGQIAGGQQKFQALLGQSFSPERALELASDLRHFSPGLKALDDLAPGEIAKLCEAEHPQTAAVVLAHLPPDRLAKTIKAFAPAARLPLLLRVAKLEAVDPEAISVAAEVLAQYSRGKRELRNPKVGGAQNLGKTLAQLPPLQQQKLLADLREKDPKLAEELEKSLVVFNDVGKLTPKELATLIAKSEQKDWLLALREVDPALKKKIFASLSPRTTALWQEELGFAAKVLRKDVLDAQQRIALKLKNLCEEGVITSLSGEQYV